MYSDTNQCDPVTDGVRIHDNYLTSMPISEMCSRRVELEYIKGCVQYDERTRDMLSKFLQTGSITTKFSPLGQYYTNICYRNATRRRINKVCCERFVQDKDSHEVHFKYDGGIETYKIAAGMPLLASQNLKKYNMFNMMEFKIEDITDENVKVNDIWFEMDKFRACFLPALCVTVYKYQGCTINTHYNVYDVIFVVVPNCDSVYLYYQLK